MYQVFNVSSWVGHCPPCYLVGLGVSHQGRKLAENFTW